MSALLSQKKDQKSGRRLAVAVVAACILGTAIAVSREWQVATERYVIITADDAGMYASVNKATIEALDWGLVSSTSIMVPCEGFSEIANYARTNSEKDFGVHLTLNSETSQFRWGPVSRPDKVRSLVDRDGFFWATAEETARYAKIAEVEVELRSQIERARSAGIRISHLDHHKNVLLTRPDLIRLYVRLAVEYDVPIRYAPNLENRLDAGKFEPELIGAYRDGLRTLAAAGIPVLTDFDSDNYLCEPERKREYFLELLRHLQPGVTEIVIHCAVQTPDGKLPRQIERREIDARIFKSVEIVDRLRRYGIRVLRWRDLRPLSRIVAQPR